MKKALLISAALLMGAAASCSQVENAKTQQAEQAEVMMERSVISAAEGPSDTSVKLAQYGSGAQTARAHFPVRRCINMGNALEAEYEGAWGYTIREKDFSTIARAGFDTVRIPVRWDLKTSKQPPYTIDSAHMQRVIDVVGQAQNAGLGVVLDVHHYKAIAEDARSEADRYLAIWAQISQAFAAAPPTVYFELLNEPTTANMGELNELYAQALRVIRRTNPTRAVMMGGNGWNAIDTLGTVRFPRDPYLVATYHDYGPHPFTHQGASWEDNPPPLGRKWGSREDIKEMRNTIAQARAFKERTGLPVFVGEFGVIDVVPARERAEWIRARRMAMEQAGLSWCAWDFSGAFKSYDTSRERWISPIKEALTGR